MNEQAPTLLEALEYLLQQTVDSDLAAGIELTEGESEAREMALAAIEHHQLNEQQR